MNSPCVRTCVMSVSRRVCNVSSALSHLLQVLMDELDRHAPLADRRGDTLDQARVHVSRREHAGPAGLQKERLPPARPVRRPRHGLPRPHEDPGVPLDLRRQPVGPRHRG